MIIYCEDFAPKSTCCISCHQDQDEYSDPMLELDFPNDIFGRVCCHVYELMGRKISHKEFHP